MRLIIPSITTHSRSGSCWRQKIREVETLHLRRIGLFVTGLSREERAECFRTLEELRRHHEFSIPFVHAVADMVDDEYRFLAATFGVEAFNLHPTRSFPLRGPLSAEVRRMTTIENDSATCALTDADVHGFAGVCLDVSHLEEARRNGHPSFAQLSLFLRTVPIGANHLSAIIDKPCMHDDGSLAFSRHTASSVDDLTYLSGYPTTYFSRYCAIELEDPLADQVRLLPRLRELIEQRPAVKPEHSTPRRPTLSDIPCFAATSAGS